MKKGLAPASSFIPHPSSLMAQQLRQMACLDAQSPAMQPAADVQQATHVAGDDGVRAGAFNGVQLALEHRAGNVAHLHGEQPAEAAALLRAG